jgi:signal transduction histidine kinase
MKPMPELSTQPATSTQLSPETIERLRQVPLLASLDEAKMHCLDGSRDRSLGPGDVLFRQGELTSKFWILLEGSLRLLYTDANGMEQSAAQLEAGTSIGEISLLAHIPTVVTARAIDQARMLELSEDHFWRLMTVCPEVRSQILGNMATRLAKMQNATFQQEKMAALGTLAAGLMHELNNPGAAARRAAATLRENLERLHRLAGRLSRVTLSDEQKECMYDLQEFVLAAKPAVNLNTIQQTDAEEALAEWMDAARIEDAWKLAPTFVSIGMQEGVLQCAQSAFPPALLSDALHWLEALVSSQQLVGVIEESIGRVTDLVHAVKSYAYEGRSQRQQLDVNRSIHATIVILSHKMREKQIGLAKDLDPTLPKLDTDCQGLNQVWTNLLDNAIDALPQGGHIYIKTWAEEVELGDAGATHARKDLCILIGDDGPGIPLDSQPHIFDPFYTTKPVGVGTGLGLGIVYRIVEQCHGMIRFSSVPGQTEFLVRLPVTS